MSDEIVKKVNTDSNPTIFAFVLNLLDVNFDLPFEIISDCFFQKATLEQITLIKKHLEPLMMYHYKEFPHDYREGVSINSPEASKYYIISFFKESDKELDRLNDLLTAATLLETKLNFSLFFKLKPLPFLYEPTAWTAICFPALFHTDFYNKTILKKSHSVSTPLQKDDLQNLHFIYDKMQELDSSFPDSPIIKAIDMFSTLDNLPRNSSVRVLSLFAVIEALITHKPNPNDSGDSITKQIKNKISLLSNRMNEKIDYSPFRNMSNCPREETIWAKLYNYRSKVAHGDKLDFTEGDLSILKEADIANSFLEITIKKLLRHSLDEPQLYIDLKQC